MIGKSFATPGLDRDGGNGVGRCAFNDLPADCQIDQDVAFFIEEAGDLGFLEDQRGTFAEHGFTIGEFFRQGNRPDLTAGQRELRWVFGQPEAAFHPAGSGLADMAGDAGDFRVIVGVNADPVVGADKLPGGGRAADFFSGGSQAEGQKQGSQKFGE